MTKHVRAAALILGFALVLPACGGDLGGSGSSMSDDDEPTATTTTEPTFGTTPSGDDVNCGELRAALGQLDTLQVLVQIQDASTARAAMSAQPTTIDGPAFLEALETLHELDGTETPAGDPKDAIDKYTDAVAKAQEIADAEEPTKAELDELLFIIGNPNDFLALQESIGTAVDESGC